MVHDPYCFVKFSPDSDWIKNSTGRKSVNFSFLSSRSIRNTLASWKFHLQPDLFHCVAWMNSSSRKTVSLAVESREGAQISPTTQLFHTTSTRSIVAETHVPCEIDTRVLVKGEQDRPSKNEASESDRSVAELMLKISELTNLTGIQTSGLHVSAVCRSPLRGLFRTPSYVTVRKRCPYRLAVGDANLTPEGFCFAGLGQIL